MPLPLQHTDEQRATARRAYETLEPLHVLAYFNPHFGPLGKEAGLGWRGSYVGARGGPLGAVPPEVVAAAFFNFSPEVIREGWAAATAHGLDAVMALREQSMDRSLREAFGDLVDNPELPGLVADLRTIAEGLEFAGRPFAASWAAQPWPEAPHLALWHATSVLREWRGDGHIATLVQAGLRPTEASVFHEATHPDPTLKRRVMGRDMTKLTRGWDDERWNAAAAALVARGLLTVGENAEALTDKGAELYAAIERATDDAAAWTHVDTETADGVLTRARPYVKAVIASGMLPGT